MQSFTKPVILCAKILVNTSKYICSTSEAFEKQMSMQLIKTRKFKQNRIEKKKSQCTYVSISG